RFAEWPAEDEMPAVSCLECGLCCQVYSTIEVLLEELDALYEDPIGERLVNISRVDGDQAYLDLTLNGQTCPAYLGDGKGCGCYELRPVVCKTFEPGLSGCHNARVRASLSVREVQHG
ncbi:YkgJ family cysteine cluster protein, partial [bacterium]|nr:YkgJ family cysteine cluster protein [bacterium]